MPAVPVTHITDPGCPFAYSAEPSITALRWRYGDQLAWRKVMIGLADEPAEYEERGYTALWMTQAWLAFRKYGMPFVTVPRPRVIATGLACRAVVATRLDHPEQVQTVLRALRFAWFTTGLMLDERAGLAAALRGLPGIDYQALVSRVDDDDVWRAYRRDREESRSAAGSPASVQGKTAEADGVERFTAPTLVFGDGLVAGGFQPLEAYEVLLVNAAPELRRRPPAESAAEALDAFPEGLTTREVAVLLAQPGAEPDDLAAAAQLIESADRGRVDQVPMGDGALWLPRSSRRFRREGVRSATEVPTPDTTTTR